METRKAYEACRLYQQVLTGYSLATDAAKEAGERQVALLPQVEEGLRSELAKLAKANGDRQRAFVERAAGFPCEAEARTLAEATGDQQLDAILAQTGATQAGRLEKFVAEWKGFACAARAAGLYEELAAKALQPLTEQAVGRRGRALVKFLKDWEECPSRVRAAELLETDLGAELAEILAVDKPSTRAGKLKVFIKAWPGTKATDQADAELQKLLEPPAK